MADITINVGVSGLDSIDADVKAELNKLHGIIDGAAFNLGNVMMESLKKHIDKDVYEAWGPGEYPRRVDHPKLGTPLNDVSENSFPIFDAPNDVFYWRVGLDYLPTGVTSATTADLDPGNPRYDADNPRLLVPNPANGNELVEIIEKGLSSWPVTPPKRPFWQNFVDEMIDGGALGSELIMQLRAQGVEIAGTYDEVIREAGDGDY